MSPRTENYLALCLEQAELSPLHHRHGCVIIKGGKVIGQGYNTYRPGFDGGSLKTGVLPNAKLDGSAIRELKLRLKTKRKSKFNISTPDDQQQQQLGHAPFTPFELLSGGGYKANEPLSMHSEMMAIQNALSLSSGAQSYQTSARSAQWLQKPCFKLSGNSKRKARLRGLKTYVEAVCAEAEAEAAQRSAGGNSVLKLDNDNDNEEEEYVAANRKESGETYRIKKNSNEVQKNQQQLQHQHKCGSQPPRSTKKTICGPDSIASSDDDSSEYSHNVHSTGNLHHQNWKKAKPPKRLEPPRSQPLLVPKGLTGQSTPKANISARTKDLRLKGADLYVARLGNSCHDKVTRPVFTESSITKPPSPLVTPPSTAPTGSLHDELKCISRNPSPPMQAEPPSVQQRPSRVSRPCYRCISHMDAVGIKRVFWSNGSGGWEGAKVRDLMDALEVSGDGVGKAGANGEEEERKSMPVFVTKHEVLMLRRKMGGG